MADNKHMADIKILYYFDKINYKYKKITLKKPGILHATPEFKLHLSITRLYLPTFP